MRLLLLFTLVMSSLACVPKGLGSAAMIRPLRLPRLGSPALPYEEFRLASGDVQLEGWLFRPRGTPKGLIVYLHGKDNNRERGALAANTFVPQGYAVLAYDQRAHGTSTGTFTTYGRYEKEDLRRALDQVKLEPVYLIGHSLGAAVALQAAAEDARIRGVVAASCFSDLPIIIRERMPGFTSEDDLEASIAQAEKDGNFKLSEISPRLSAAKLTVPVLLIHGMGDTFTTPDHSKRIFEALPEANRRLVSIAGAGHEDVMGYPEVWASIDGWMGGHFAEREVAPSSGQ